MCNIFFCQNRCYCLIDSRFTSDTIFPAPFSWLKSLIERLPHMSVYDTLLHFQVHIFSPVWTYVYVFIMWAGVVCHSDIAVNLLVTISGDNVKTRWLKCWKQTAETRHKMRRKKTSMKNYAEEKGEATFCSRRSISFCSLLTWTVHWQSSS